MLCAVIMAGGKGTRFWPLSTEEKPKQFLDLFGKETMIQMTVSRLRKMIPIERIFIVTGKKYGNLVKQQIPDLPERNIIQEPVGKNTAPCIGLAALVIEKYYKDATLIVLPSDHLISDDEMFIKTVKVAEEFIQDKINAILTLGIKPKRAETGYGYIEFTKERMILDDFEIRKVHAFVEKPNKEKAKEYYEDGHYLWNAGMFIWKTSTILNMTKEYLSSTYDILSEIVATSDNEFQAVLDRRYSEVEDISVDYGIMENAQNIYVLPVDFGWDDVGTWYSVERLSSKDDTSNSVLSENKVFSINSSNNTIVSISKPIVLAGISDMMIVESENLILISHKTLIDDIKNIKEEVEKKYFNEVLI
ncbi:mannose-1-phosphate guanylyltransferase [Clostridium sp. DL1XJH146]